MQLYLYLEVRTRVTNKYKKREEKIKFLNRMEKKKMEYGINVVAQWRRHTEDIEINHKRDT